MANPKIEVEIGAITDKLKKGVDGSILSLNQLEKEAQDLNKALANATDVKDIVRLNSQLANTRQAMQNLRNAGVQPLTQATAQFNSVGVDFARIIQDAPFGIIGVGNNITQLASSFQNARNQGKSFTQILGSIFSSSNLLILGVSALTTALTIYQMSSFKSEEATKSLRDELDQYRETLDKVVKASIESASNAQKESQSLNLLRKQAENVNIPQKVRLEAVAELQKKYPEYLGNLTSEQILTGEVGDAYSNLTKEIIATAKARAFSDEIAKNSLDLLTIEQQELSRVNEIIQAREKLESIQQSKRLATGQDLLALTQQERIQQQRINDLVFEQIDSANQRVAIENENLDLQNKINVQIEAGAKFTSTQLDGIKEIKRVYEDILKLPKAPSLGIPTTPTTAPQTRGVTDGRDKTIPEQIANYLRLLQDFNNQASDILNQGVGNTIGDFAFAIGDAIASGGNVLKSAGAALLSGLAGILNQLGQLAIGTGIAIAGIKKALQTLNPAVAIGAGVALVALAGFVSSKAKSLGNFGGGGSVSSVGSTGVSGGSASQTFGGSGSTGLSFDRSLALTGEFRVKGQDLVYVFNEASSRNAKG